MISHEYPPIGGGGANACMSLAKEYSQKGNEVHIVTVWYEGEKEYEELINNNSIFIYRLKSKRKYVDHCSFMEMLDYLRLAYSFSDKLEKKEKFDICQIFFGIPSGPIGYHLKNKYKLPYVIRFGGGDIPGFQDRFQIIYKFISPIVKYIWKKSDALVANSEGLKKLAEDFYDKKEIIVIPNGVNIRAFSNESFLSKTILKKEKEEYIRLLFVSRLIERKGLQDILPQLRYISERCSQKGLRIQLDVVGDGPYKADLEKIAKEEEISDIICFHGQKNKDQLPMYYSNADIFVFPSRKEGMPNVVLEAMSYGLPIIMTPCQGSEELITNNGYITEYQKFGEKILSLCLNADKRKKMGNNSVKLVEEEFSWSNTSNLYLKIFSEIVSRKKDN